VINNAVYNIAGGDYERGGSASKNLKEMLKKIGVESAVVRRTMVAAYEAEMNVVIHATEGSMRVAVDPSQVDVAVIDNGPGISDVQQAMREGFSTAPAKARELGFGAGLGLPNIKRNTDRFSLTSTPNEGTQVRFTIYLNNDQRTTEKAPNSVLVDSDRCRECLLCLRACPTSAVRIRDGGPHILRHLCVDCTSCIAACDTGALAMPKPAAVPTPDIDSVLVIPASLLAQFGDRIHSEQVLDILLQLGFGQIRFLEEWDIALRAAVAAYAREGMRPRPILSPMCPAVVNLIQVRFPSLLANIAPFLTPIEAVREELTASHVAVVPVCPSQHTALLPKCLLTNRDTVQAKTMLDAIMVNLSESPVSDGPYGPAQVPSGVLQVSGMQHVVKVLEEVENGRMDYETILELYACEQTCFGSPVWKEDAFVTRARWHKESHSFATRASAVHRAAALSPRPGLRLDSDMAKAIEKLSQIDTLTRELPGRDCGVCGAPTCAALAEDVVLGRAEISACAYRGIVKDNPLKENCREST